jgi:hypothetical protein
MNFSRVDEQKKKTNSEEQKSNRHLIFVKWDRRAEGKLTHLAAWFHRSEAFTAKFANFAKKPKASRTLRLRSLAACPVQFKID